MHPLRLVVVTAVGLALGPLTSCSDDSPSSASSASGDGTGTAGTSDGPADDSSSTTGTTSDGEDPTQTTSSAPTSSTTDPSSTTDEGTSGDETGTSGGISPPVCDGDVLTSDVFLPGEVYLLGTGLPGSCGRDLISHVGSPNQAVAGFSCYGYSTHAEIRPTDGRFLYVAANARNLREFTCDTCPYDGSAPYPEDTESNDPVLPTPGCDDSPGVWRFLFDPAGQYYYTCLVSGTAPPQRPWYDAAGDVVLLEAPDEPAIHIGHDGLILTPTTLRNLDDPSEIAIEGFVGDDFSTARADPEGGFWAVSGSAEASLWHIGPDGSATHEGDYPPLPPGSVAYEGKLSACLGLHQFVWDSGGASTDDTIYRREVGGVAEDVYGDAGGGIVRIHISSLVTGP